MCCLGAVCVCVCVCVRPLSSVERCVWQVRAGLMTPLYAALAEKPLFRLSKSGQYVKASECYFMATGGLHSRRAQEFLSAHFPVVDTPEPIKVQLEAAGALPGKPEP